MHHYDCIVESWKNLAKPLGLSKMRLGPKHLRKTSATILGSHPQYKFYAPHFLGHAPTSVTEKHYVSPNEEEFSAALTWLRGKLLG